MKQEKELSVNELMNNLPQFERLLSLSGNAKFSYAMVKNYKALSSHLTNIKKDFDKAMDTFSITEKDYFRAKEYISAVYQEKGKDREKWPKDVEKQVDQAEEVRKSLLEKDMGLNDKYSEYSKQVDEFMGRTITFVPHILDKENLPDTITGNDLLLLEQFNILTN